MERVFFDLDTNKIQPKGNAPFFMPQKNLFRTGVILPNTAVLRTVKLTQR